ncbi:MAG: hypothetical protein IJO74_01325 [Clostridia bacterium]|nr:hypothetical protein [Clostridia bacterium]
MTDNSKLTKNAQSQLAEQEELETLRRENRLREKVTKEIDSLWEMFPDIKLEEVPEELWDMVSQGESLLGAYCILLAKKNLETEKAEKKDRENSEKTPPNVKPGAEKSDYFTREAVSKMSRDQVRKNYDKIVESMKHWN